MRRTLPLLLLTAACGGGEDPNAPREVAYACDRGIEIRVVFNPVSRIASVIGIVSDSRDAVLLPARPAGSGFRYASDRVELRGKGEEAMLTVDGSTLRCTVAAAGPEAG